MVLRRPPDTTTLPVYLRTILTLVLIPVVVEILGPSFTVLVVVRQPGVGSCLDHTTEVF